LRNLRGVVRVLGAVTRQQDDRAGAQPRAERQPGRGCPRPAGPRPAPPIRGGWLHGADSARRRGQAFLIRLDAQDAGRAAVAGDAERLVASSCVLFRQHQPLPCAAAGGAH
jgi:hypothetical protein